MRILAKKKSIPAKTLQKNIVTVTGGMNTDEIIKSARVYKNSAEIIYLDYRLFPEYKTDKDRTRMSTGIPYSAQKMREIERDKMNIALQHFLKHNEISDGVILFKDIALVAVQEESDSRMPDIQQDYENILNNHILKHFANKQLTDIRVSDLKQWKKKLLAKHPMSLSRYKKYHRVMNMIFKYAYLNEYLNKNLMDLVDRRSNLFTVKTKPEHLYYSSNEVKAILGSAEGWVKTFLTTLFYCGMRTGESLALKFSDIDFENNKITLQRSIRHGRIRNSTKTGTTNVINMPEPVKLALLALKEHSRSQEWIFPNPVTLKPFYQPKSIVDTYFKPLLKSLNIEYRTLYATRHSCASIMLEMGVPLTYIQKQLTHKKLSTTMDYYIKHSNVDDSKQREVVDKLFA